MSDAPVADDAAIVNQGVIPTSLYVHLPWCVRKCPYCDFNSHAVRGEIDQAAYVDALLRDFDVEHREQPITELHSIFIGGGTPSLFDDRQIARLLDGIDQRVGLRGDVEITLEANPGTAEVARFAGFRTAGVNRLSIGVQSFDDAKLTALGRIHSADDARAAMRMARAAGFDNVNLDLMYGLPEQILSQALADLTSAIALGPEHLSWYQLTLEPNTLFHHQPPRLPDEDAIAAIMDAGQASLAEAGYSQYEISAYATVGRRCGHNLNYWQFGDYVGIGAGAHGKRTDAHGRIRRRSKQRQPAAYLESIGSGGLQTERKVTEQELAVEFFLNVLRLVEGVPAGYLKQRTGLTLEDIDVSLHEARRRGLMEHEPSRLCPTRRGLDFLNDLLALFEPVT